MLLPSSKSCTGTEVLLLQSLFCTIPFTFHCFTNLQDQKGSFCYWPALINALIRECRQFSRTVYFVRVQLLWVIMSDSLVVFWSQKDRSQMDGSKN